MAGSSGFSISISAVDKTSSVLDGLNKRLARLSAPAERFNKALNKFGDTSGLSRVTESVRGLGAGAADAFRSLDRMASPLATITSVGSIAGMAALTRKWAEFGNQIGQVSYRLNMPVEKLGALRGAMRLAGGNAADLDSGLAGLDEKLRGATFGKDQGAVQTFNALHIAFRNASGSARTAADVLGDVADAMKGRTPGAQHAILDHLGLGDGFLPLLKNGRKGLEDFEKQAEQTGGVMTGEMVAHASAMNKAWQELGETIEGVGNRLIDKYAPAVTKALEVGSHWIQQNPKLADSLAKVGAEATIATAAVGAFARIFGLGILPSVLRKFGPLGLLGLTGPAGGEDPAFSEQKNQEYLRDHPQGSSWWERSMPTWLGGTPATPRAITVPRAPTVAAAAMKRAHDYFRAKGLTEGQTAGILANISAESGFDPTRWGDNGTSYGLFQDHADRLTKMQQRYGTQAPTEQQQLDYAWDELQGPERATYDLLRQTRTAGEAGAVFSGGFERPAGGLSEDMRRGHAADQFVQADGAPAANGHVQVDVHIKGAPAGTTAKVASSGQVTAPPPRIETPMVFAN